MKENRKIYLDYSATTPVDPLVKKTMLPFFDRQYGNPGSIHQFGQQASTAVFAARQTIARALGASYKNIIFTGSATEANNLVLHSCAAIAREQLKEPPRFLVSVIEHESVLAPARFLQKQGIEVIFLPVDSEGIIKIDFLEKELDKNAALISIMRANNEIGTIQPIERVIEIIQTHRQKTNNLWPLFHTDAVQAFQFLNCDTNFLTVDFLTISAHKIYGPKGIGALYARNPMSVRPLILGGGQEENIRSGTENVPAIVGFGQAVTLVEKYRTKEVERLQKLQNYFLAELKKIFPKMRLNGSAKNRLPHITNVYLPGTTAHDRCIELDLLGIAVSPGVACSARSAEPSYVIEALNLDKDRSSSSIRFSFGRFTTKEELDIMFKIIKNNILKY